MLDDYQEGVLIAKVPVRKHWYQFWLPEYVDYEYASYVKIGRVWKLWAGGKQGLVFAGDLTLVKGEVK